MTHQFTPTIHVNKAHDVRQLRVCLHCGKIGDRRYMVVTNSGLLHGGCALNKLGSKGLLSLPPEEQDKLSIGEIGPDVMVRIINDRLKKEGGNS